MVLITISTKSVKDMYSNEDGEAIDRAPNPMMLNGCPTLNLLQAGDMIRKRKIKPVTEVPLR